MNGESPLETQQTLELKHLRQKYQQMEAHLKRAKEALIGIKECKDDEIQKAILIADDAIKELENSDKVV
jgi:hypothetical protein